ncbi:MAG: hypothetical protein HC915_15025 [Anaerolineae bacterium]|nr:hypothetical protein [Anaerolineae bacterium]
MKTGLARPSANSISPRKTPPTGALTGWERASLLGPASAFTVGVGPGAYRLKATPCQGDPLTLEAVEVKTDFTWRVR